MKIKILHMCGKSYDEDIILQGISDWEEVTEEEYKNLKEWIIDRNSKKNKQFIWGDSDILTIYCQSDFNTIDYFRNLEKKWKDEQKTRKARAEKTAATKKRKKLEKERKLLEELKAKEAKGEL